MTKEEIVIHLKKTASFYPAIGPACLQAATLIEQQAKELEEAERRINFGVKCNDDLQATVDKQAKEIDTLSTKLVASECTVMEQAKELEELMSLIKECEGDGGCRAYKALLAENKPK